MPALSRAEEHLRAARREIEAALSEVPDAYSWDLRRLAADVGATRQRVQAIRAATGPTGAA